MDRVIIEIKAKLHQAEHIRTILKDHKADFQGLDHQIDTYFKVNNGRLKLREGNIENHLIYYNRENKSGPKQSNVILFNTDPKSSLKEILTTSMGVLVVVDKKREIYFVDNIKFHIDEVKNLGAFVEIEAIGKSGEEEKLRAQCETFVKKFGIEDKDLISHSYSDLLLG